MNTFGFVSIPFMAVSGFLAMLGLLGLYLRLTRDATTNQGITASRSQPRVVMFMAHWCPHCQDEVSSLVERFATEGIRSDVELLAISTNVDEGAPNYSPSQWLLGEGWSVPVLRDSANDDLAAGFGLSGFPFFVVVDEEGEIVTRRSGAVPRTQWNSFLDQALTGGSDIAG